MSSDQVWLHKVSPCEHGVEHDILELPVGTKRKGEVWFSTRKCKDSRGKPRQHEVTAEKYPEKRRTT